MIHQTYHLAQRYPNVSFGEVPISAYAFTSNLQPFDAYGNATVLADAWQGARQLLFSLAVNAAMAPAQGDSVAKGTYVTTQGAIFMSRTFTILAQSFLSVILALCLVLMLATVTRNSRIKREPSSLAAILGNVSTSLRESLRMLQSGTIDKDDLIRATKFKINTESRIDASSAQQLTRSEIEAAPTKNSSDRSRSLAYPLGLRLPEQGLLMCALLVVIIFLGVLHQRLTQTQGFVLNASSDFANQLVLNYIPIVFSTSLEPVWVMLARDLSFLQPFDTLSRGRALGKSTLTTPYTSRPPQFCVISALSRKHLLLAVVAVNALLANVLNVAMGGLFQPRQVSVFHPATFQQNQSAIVGQDLLRSQAYSTDPDHAVFDYMMSLDGTYDSPPQPVP